MCQEKYVGETGRLWHTRLKEHNRSTVMGDGHSAMSDHYTKSHKNLPEIPFEASIIERGSDFVDRKIREGIFIRQRKPAINRDNGWASLSAKYRHRFSCFTVLLK